ncbi:hypothetical protein ACIRON_03855 [Nocardioides sp. NPDC101246]|uniref:hypothetical protein n=1 Tax=Nocardioides sp. NPDC101246 TaxID=3364336 RepID=UPI0037FC1A66
MPGNLGRAGRVHNRIRRRAGSVQGPAERNIVRIQIRAASPDGAPATSAEAVDAWLGDTPYLKVIRARRRPADR